MYKRENITMYNEMTDTQSEIVNNQKTPEVNINELICKDYFHIWFI